MHLWYALAGCTEVHDPTIVVGVAKWVVSWFQIENVEPNVCLEETF